MSVNLEDIELAARQLEPRARGELIRRLLRTFENADSAISDEEWAAAWSDEVERRDQEIETGNVVPLKGVDVLREWQERFP